MAWTRKQKLVRTNQNYQRQIKNNMNSVPLGGAGGAAGNKFSSLLPEVYAGHPMRIERYGQYDEMDRDSEVNTALSIIANYCTQDDPNSDLKFTVKYNENIADSEMEITEKLLRQWSKINRFKTRLWRMFRSTLKYGDQFFLRDPETLEWYWVDPSKVEKVLVNEAEGKEVEAYIVRDLDINRTMGTATAADTYGNDLQNASTNTLQNQVGYQNRYGNVTHYGHYADGIQNVTPVAAEHMIHLTLSEGLDAGWPFGTSILESVFKVFRQKELLEDAILIYRIIRAPERRVFYVDVGSIPPHRAGAYLEHFKNAMNQTRMPSRSQGSSTVLDSSLSAISPDEDYYFATGENGRGSRVEILPGGENLGCFSLDTKVRLLNGTDRTILELENDLKNGITNWTYSCHPITGEIVPGKITWAGPTRKNTEVMKFILDNGEHFICTPDHKFPIENIGFIEAKDLVEGQVLFSYKNSNNTNIEKYIKENLLEIDNFIELENCDIVISKIEYLEETMDVGTITVDGNEEYHDYHTFALSVGVFTKNSINDLVFWNNKLIRGLGVPAGYLPYGPEDGGVSYNDGRLGTAYQQEYNFAQYCMRLQNLLVETFDREFKLFVKQRGYNIDASSFNIDLVTPQHFSEYAKIERDSASINNFNSMVNLPFISPRFAMEYFLGLSKADILKNEQYMLEENPDENIENETEENSGFDSIGIRGGSSDFGGNDMDFDSGNTEFDNDVEAPASAPDSDLDLPV